MKIESGRNGKPGATTISSPAGLARWRIAVKKLKHPHPMSALPPKADMVDLLQGARRSRSDSTPRTAAVEGNER